MVHAGCYSVSIIHRTLAGTTGSLTCAQMLMYATAHGGVQTPLPVTWHIRFWPCSVLIGGVLEYVLANLRRIFSMRCKWVKSRNWNTCVYYFIWLCFCELNPVLNCEPCEVPMGSPSRGGDVEVYRHEPAKLSHFFLFCSCVCFCLCGPFNCISLHKFSRQLSAFSLCSSGLISALLVHSSVYLFTKVSFSPDVILCGWLGLKHQLTN